MRKLFRINLDPGIDNFCINPTLKMLIQTDRLLTEMLTRLQQATSERTQETRNCPTGHLTIKWMDQTQGAILSMTELT